MSDQGIYSKEVMKHFLKPKNMGRLKPSNGTGEAGNLLCGDIMKIYIKVKKDKKTKKRKIVDIKFECMGCVVAIANSSMITTMAKGKTLEETIKITKDDIIKKLGKIPPIKIHCSILAVDALHEAIYDYYLRNKLSIPSELQKEHERIQKAIKTIEEGHKEYTELEKRVLEQKN
jgi:nitrogen fixation NifU-like protein